MYDFNSRKPVKRQFIKRILALHDFSSRNRLSALNLDSLELRRLRADLYLLYKNHTRYVWNQLEVTDTK